MQRNANVLSFLKGWSRIGLALLVLGLGVGVGGCEPDEEGLWEDPEDGEEDAEDEEGGPGGGDVVFRDAEGPSKGCACCLTKGCTRAPGFDEFGVRWRR